MKLHEIDRSALLQSYYNDVQSSMQRFETDPRWEQSVAESIENYMGNGGTPDRDMLDFLFTHPSIARGVVTTTIDAGLQDNIPRQLLKLA